MKESRLPNYVSALVKTVAFLVLLTPNCVLAESWDLATDWSLCGKDLAGIPFGPDAAWGVYSIDGSGDGWTWKAYDRAMHFTYSNPWFHLYNIDGWWLGETPTRRKPMLGKNAGDEQWGPGNIPGQVSGVNFDWPEGKIAGCTWPDPKGKQILLAVAWTAHEVMTVTASGSTWIAGQHLDIAQRRTRIKLWIDRAVNGIGSPDEIIFDDALVPLWTEGCNSSHPKTFAEILAKNAAKLESISVSQGDRICVGFYWDKDAEKGGMNGIDFKIIRSDSALHKSGVGTDKTGSVTGAADRNVDLKGLPEAAREPRHTLQKSDPMSRGYQI